MRSSALNYADFATSVRQYDSAARGDKRIPDCEEKRACMEALRAAAAVAGGGQLTGSDLAQLKRLQH
jgi:hypothetical protein